MTPFGYARLLLGSLACILAGVAGLNLAVDPYDVIGAPRIAGFNAIKPHTSEYTHLIKPYQAIRTAPHAVLLGSSRADVGIEPDSPLWPDDVRPVYDFGLPGTDVTLLFSAFRHAAAAGDLRLAVAMLDFEPFLATAPARSPGASERRMLTARDGTPNTARLSQHIADVTSAILTTDALFHSVGTLLQQHGGPMTPDLSPHGSTGDGGFAGVVATDGYGVLFAQKDVEYGRRAATYARSLAAYSGETPAFGTLREMIAFARTHGIRTVLVIPPHHADLLEIYHAAGVWDRFEAWKTILARMVGDYGGGFVTLWDFSGYDQYSTEGVPKKGDGQATRWFWEPGHFKKALGALVIRRVLTGEPSSFGVELTPDTIGADLLRIRHEREVYRATQSAQIARLSETLQAAGRSGIPD